MSAKLEAQVANSIDWKWIQNETEKIILHHSKTFYFATGLLPSNSRSAIRALYGFCRKTDDLVDQEGACAADLEQWRAEVNRPLEEQSDPVLMLWTRVRQTYAVDRRFEKELIDGVGMDLGPQVYNTWAELENYCYHVASTVGLLSIPIIGLAPGADLKSAQEYAIRLGIALQLTNILRDIGEDLSRGRIYLPREDLERFGVSIQDIRDRVVDERFKALMRFEIDRARQLYESSLAGIALLNPVARPAVGAAAMIYAAILDQIEKIDFQVYQKRAHTSALQKIALLPKILLRIYQQGT